MADEGRKEKIAALIKWGLGLLGAIIISPIIFLAVKGINKKI
jgi:short subunit fatty acids transporter